MSSVGKHQHITSMSGKLRCLGTLGLIALLAACAARQPAPVSENRLGAATPPRTTTPVDSQAKPATTPAEKAPDSDRTYVIQKGDTLISIALQNGLAYRDLAAWNNIENPNVIKLGETLRLTAPGTPAVASSASPPGAQPKPGEPVTAPLIMTPVPTAVPAPVNPANPVGTPSATPPVTGVVAAGNSPGNTDKLKTEPKVGKVPYSDAAYAKLSAEATSAPATAGATTPPVVITAPVAPPVVPIAATSTDVDWSWPIQPPPKTKIIGPFSDASKGIDIGGTKGTAILAAGNGEVVYSGAGMRGYGRLVIIKHNDMWLSAYAHNEKIIVQEGQKVKKGQQIAEMGSSDADQVKLHFEIRRQGKPLDPLKFLPN